MTSYRPAIYLAAGIIIFYLVYDSLGGFGSSEPAVVPYNEYQVIEEYKTYEPVQLDEGLYVGTLELDGFTYIASYEIKSGNRLVKRAVIPDQTIEQETTYYWDGAVLMFESDNTTLFAQQGLPIIKASEDTFRIDADYSITVYTKEAP